MRIIIVEDEQRSRIGLRKLIISISDSYEVVAEASNGQQGVELIKALNPDVVVTDIKMPFMDGMQMIKAVRSLNIKTEFIILSAYEQFETARQAISMDVKEFLIKPLTYDEVESALKRVHSGVEEGVREIKSSIVNEYENIHPLIRKSLIIIENNYGSKIGEAFIAETLNISKEYFSYLFRKNIGTTYCKFLSKYRIDMAKTLLLNNGVQKSEIPYSVGFSDPKYFSKVFREQTGESVTEFMKNNKER